MEAVGRLVGVQVFVVGVQVLSGVGVQVLVSRIGVRGLGGCPEWGGARLVRVASRV